MLINITAAVYNLLGCIILIMQVLPRWRNVLILKSSITQSTTTTTQLASFHSTPALFEKWRNKFAYGESGDQQQPKNYIRYAVRQKRADTKRALKSILFKGGCSTSRAESFPEIEADYAEQVNKKSRIKSARQAKRDHKKSKRKHRRDDPFEDFDDNPDRIFHAAFGNHEFTWRFKPSGMRFDWTENYCWENSRFNQQDDEHGKGSSGDSYIVGTYADRKILGLPTTGPLKIEDVKAAFRSSALMWHPDKHQGSSKADAEEKFKHCVDAYKTLCNSLSTA